ncbi:MAG: ATP-grasp domain-containing protein [Rhodocyclaceae bacterium]|nr:ATP-grasp domain-containing protein [Rhodocyclaceae bacterium]
MAGAPLVVVAASARALAECVRRAGLPGVGLPLLAVDAFGDDDLLAAVDGHAHLALSALRRAGAVCAAVDAVLAGYAAAAPGDAPRAPAAGGVSADVSGGVAPSATPARADVLLGGGFDGAPAVVSALAARHRLLNAPPDAWAAARDPLLFARLGIAAPDSRLEAPVDQRGWLRKDGRGSAGLCVRPANLASADDEFDRGTAYWQRRIAGTPVSLLFCAHRDGILPIGINRQWCSPVPSLPFRFGGVVSGFDPGMAVRASLIASASRITAATGLRGLASLDAMLDRHGGVHAIELNPRPTASVELYDCAAPGVMALHVAAVLGAPLPGWQAAVGSRALALVYAGHAMQAGQRPAAAADWRRGASVCAGAPLCTVHASAPDAAAAMRRARALAGRLARQQRPYRQGAVIGPMQAAPPESQGFFYNSSKFS